MFGIITLLNPSCRQVSVMSVTQDENIDISCSSTETDGMSKSPESNQIADACVLGFFWLSSYFGSGPTLLYVGKYPPIHTNILDTPILQFRGREIIFFSGLHHETYGTEAWMSILNDLKEINCEAVFISVLPVYTKSQDISIEKEQGCWHFQRKKVIYFLFYIFKDLTLNLICKGNDIKISWHLYNDVKYRSTIIQIQFYTWLAI